MSWRDRVTLGCLWAGVFLAVLGGWRAEARERDRINRARAEAERYRQGGPASAQAPLTAVLDALDGRR